MTRKIYFISDTHFGHANILTFKRADGTPLREFSNVDEMDEYMIEKWNSVVRPQDKVYHLGDVVINSKFLYRLDRLNGHKRLVRGNHDIYKTKLYSQYFEEIHGVRVFGGFDSLPKRTRLAASHVPLHPDCVDRWGFNIHGHLHSNVMKDKRYINVSVEQLDYTPISMDEVISIMEDRV